VPETPASLLAAAREVVPCSSGGRGIGNCYADVVCKRHAAIALALERAYAKGREEGIEEAYQEALTSGVTVGAKKSSREACLELADEIRALKHDRALQAPPRGTE
jgi:hypothetical protein